MQLKNRLQKVENTFKSLNHLKYNAVVIVEKSDEQGMFRFTAWDKQVHEGTRERIDKLLQPYKDSGSPIIWDDIPRDYKRRSDAK